MEEQSINQSYLKKIVIPEGFNEDTLIEIPLPLGYIDANGTVYKKVEYTRFGGEQRKMLGDRKVRQNGGKLITAAVMACANSLIDEQGNKLALTEEIANRLTSPDREHIIFIGAYLKNLRANTLEAKQQTPCPHCSRPNQEVLNEYLINFTDPSFIEMYHPISDKFKVEKRRWIIEIDVKYDGVSHKIKIAMTDGKTQIEIFPIVAKNEFEGQLEGLKKSILAIDGAPIQNDINMAKWDTSQIDSIDIEIGKILPYVKILAEMDCVFCGEHFVSEVMFVDFLLFTPQMPLRMRSIGRLR